MDMQQYMDNFTPPWAFPSTPWNETKQKTKPP